MKQFLLNFFWFISIPFFTYVPFCLFVIPVILQNNLGPNTEKQISDSFRNLNSREFDMLILGNSRLYRGLNPDAFNIDTFNFSHDNDTYNQLYYKLIYLNNNKKNIDFLILGVDYFQFGFQSDTRNYVYKKYLHEDYLKDYPFKFYEINYFLNLLKPSQFFNLFNLQNKGFLKKNGQYIKHGKANKNNYVERKTDRIDIQVKYFMKILEFSKKKDIKIFLVMPPLRPNELNVYNKNEIKEFNSFIKKMETSNLIYFNFTKNHGYDINDFTDITHLNESAANRFSRQLNDSIEKYKLIDDSLIQF